MNRTQRLSLLLVSAVAGAAAVAAAHDDHHPVNERNATIVERGEYRLIRSNGLPGHETGQFPNRGNPNRISAQDYTFRVPLTPTVADGEEPRGRPRGHVLFGVALNGVPWDPGTAEIWRDGQHVRGGPPSPNDWLYEAINGDGQGQLGLDDSRAHVQPTGAYHYHGLPHALVEQLSGGNRSNMLLIGWAADGYPIYAPWGHADAGDAESEMKELISSYQLKEGRRPQDGPPGNHDGTFTQDYEYVAGSGDLDEYNGREGVTPEFPEGTFYYVITEQFPFVARAHRGEPDASFSMRPEGPVGMGGPGGPEGRGERRSSGGRRPPPPRR